MPLIWARTQLDSLRTGETLEILATDPSAISNFQSFARTTGHELVEYSEDAGVIRLLIRKTR
jgi:tRNA 2-thiouridine synthesizing protein A